jgi:acetylornithine deacetylase/succinyl-diaminopimelate desuccinylase-like protein
MCISLWYKPFLSEDFLPMPPYDLAVLTAIDRHIEENLEASLAELSALCAQPSISAQGVGIQECAALVAGMLEKRGFIVHIEKTAGNPVVYAEAPGTSEKTMLFYNHYDVQPPEPLDLWESPPFTPTIRDGKMFARGVSDDKGHIQCRFAALDAIKAVTGSYPCRVKFVIEGEEETSSVSLPGYVHANAEKLKADGCIWEFGAIDDQGRPMQVLGLRGICYVEFSVKVMEIDAHSGYGSVLPNAAWRLIWALNTLKDAQENILIPGFYDNVRPLDPRAAALAAAMPEDSDELASRHGLIAPFIKGINSGPAFRQQQVLQPSLTICGLTAGYQGPKSKTVIPARASAKADFRLVPDQTPEEILHKLRQHLAAQGFSDVEVEFLGGEGPARTNPDDPLVKIAVETARQVYGTEVIISPSSGGSGPNHVFMEALHVPIITAGLSYPGAQVHAPNENMVIDHFVKGAQHTARILCAFSA